MVGTRHSFDFQDDDDAEHLVSAGKALLAPPKGKDQLLRTLKGAGEALAEAAQSSENAKHAARDLATALVRPTLLQHKDKEVRLYDALCLCHILRLNAPDTPYTDAELQSIFELLTSVYAELDDPFAPHFQLCLSILETVAQVKCSLLVLDLPNSEELVCSLFSTLLDVINEDTAAVLEGMALELLRCMLEEADDIPQSQLDVLLARLLPGHAAEAPASAAAAAALLQRAETVVQPYVQKLLTALLLGSRTDSELKDDYHSLFFVLHQTLPQTMLPVMPLLRDELEVQDNKQRGAAADLVAKLLTGPGGGAIIDEYPALLDALLKRTCDTEAEVRRRVLECCRPLWQACSGSQARQAEVVRAAVARLYDSDDSVRRAAVGAVAGLLQAAPPLATSTATEGRGTVLSCLIHRLRDKKLGVRKEAAGQLALVMRAWVLAAAEDPGAVPSQHSLLGIPLVLCNLAVRDAELGAHVFDVVFRAGIFPAKLPPAAVAHYWALLWRQAGEDNRPMLAQILQGKAAMQGRVQQLISLRAAAKEQRAASLAGAASSMGGAAASGSLGGGGGQRPADPSKALQELLQVLAATLRHDVSKPEEGLQRLVEQKDNHIFKGLATLAAYGCSHKEALAAGKDVMQRVGSKGPAADAMRALVARLTPALLPPEVLHAAMEDAEGSQEAQRLLVDVAGAAPQLLAQSLDQVLALFGADDPLLAECGAKVLARAGHYMLAHCGAAKREVPDSLRTRLAELCQEGSPGCVKAAVKALVVVSGAEAAAQAGADLTGQLMERLKSPATLASHRALLAALKGLSMLGRLLPDVLEPYADELVEFVLTDLMGADLSRGKPLREVDAERTGRRWRHPSPSTHIKAAALRTLCQALVPDSSRFRPSAAQTERARLVWEALEPLADPDPHSEQFARFDFVFPRSDDKQRSKRRRVEGSEEEEEAAGDLECTG